MVKGKLIIEKGWVKQSEKKGPQIAPYMALQIFTD
jgi:hypothetical protein